MTSLVASHVVRPPELFAFALNQKSRIRDFYFPNDTHLSMFGQLALGERMLEAIGTIVPPPKKPVPEESSAAKQ